MDIVRVVFVHCQYTVCELTYWSTIEETCPVCVHYIVECRYLSFASDEIGDNSL